MANKNFRDEIDALISTGKPIEKDQSVPVVVNTKSLFEKIADKCDTLASYIKELGSNKANTTEVYTKKEIDERPTDNSDNLVTSGSIASAIATISPRYGVEPSKTVIMLQDGTRIIDDFTGSLGFNDLLEASVPEPSDNIVAIYLGNTVTELGESVFAFHEKLTVLDAPSVTTIADNALHRCLNLEKVNIPSVASIGASSFAECEKLESVYVPNIEIIDNLAFSKCSNLREINLGNNLTAVPILGNVNAFDSGTDAKYTIVVPDAIIADLKNESPWNDDELVKHVCSYDDWQFVRKKDLNVFGNKLDPIKELSLIGNNEYFIEDLKIRIDVILTVLKSLGDDRLSMLDTVEPIGDREYLIDDVKNILDTILIAIKTM